MLNDLLDTFDIGLSQSQRLLTLEIAGASLLPHRLVGEERVSEPFTYTLDCISQQGDIELKTLMAQPARLSILQADGSYRPLHGLVSEAALLGEDGGVTYYQLTLVPWLAMLKLGRDSRIFQDRSVADVLTDVFDGHELAKGRYRFDLRRDYPARSYCVQYRESDFNFVSRLCEEEGLFYYAEFAGDD
ncbi:type VI secretion system Vgr family protein, partial [Salinicola socius]